MSDNLTVFFDSSEWEESFNEYPGKLSKDYIPDIIIKSKSGEERIPVLLLSGESNKKLKKLQEFIDYVPGSSFNRRICIYSGNITPEIRIMCSKYNITLCRKIVINHGSFYKTIEATDIKKAQVPTMAMALIKSKEGKKIFIIREMLEAIKLSDGMNITKIIYKCNLNYQYAIKLLEDLAGRGVIQLIDYKGGIKYKITATGIKYLNDLKSI